MTNDVLNAVPRGRSLRTLVFESVRSAIAERRMGGGALYSVEQLSRQLGVSRTPVREAVLDLAARGMVQVERNQGFRVVEMTLDDLREVLTLRLLAEVPATHHATVRASAEDVVDLRRRVERMFELRGRGDSDALLAADRDFHRRIVEIAGSRRLTDDVDRLRDLMTLHDHYSREVRRELDDHLDDHAVIVDAMARRDPVGAARAAREHVEHIARSILVHAGDATGRLDWADAVGPPTTPTDEEPR